MSPRKKLSLIAGAVLVVAVLAALWRSDDVQPIGTLSRQDVLEIRKLVLRSEAPRWSWFTLANLSRWPDFIRQKLTFRITGIREYPISVFRIRPDGTREGPAHRVFVHFRAQGLGYDSEGTCLVERMDGRWTKGFPAVDLPNLLPGF